jgi:predicted O-methyltransferase YrrM
MNLTAPSENAERIARAAVREQHAIQQEDELAMLVHLVEGINPRFIAEIGCDAGGTLFAWRSLCNAVYGITLPVSPPGEGMYPQGQHPLNDHGALVFICNSHTPAAYRWLCHQLGTHPLDFLFIDGDHDPEGVLLDVGMYGPLVRPGGIIALDDVLNPDLRVSQAWEFIARHGGYHPLVIEAGDHPAGIGVLRVP